LPDILTDNLGNVLEMLHVRYLMELETEIIHEGVEQVLTG